jgi:cell division septum initiation protein DivIVA
MVLSEEKIDGVSIDLIPAWELGLHAEARRPSGGVASAALAEIKRLRARVTELEDRAAEVDRRGEQSDREHQRLLDHACARSDRWRSRAEAAEARVKQMEDDAEAEGWEASERLED